MSVFQWSSLFETGLVDVDNQHRRLVELVNEFDRNVNSGSSDNIDRVLQALADYTVYHFRCEEEIMARERVAEAHAAAHRATHQRFVQQVATWIECRRRGEVIRLQQLVDFLVNWLIFHILGDDQSMGWQVRAIRAGVSAQAAFDGSHNSDDPRTDVLLGALRQLYAGLVARNDDLLASQRVLSELNASLEERVAARTAELVAANRQLREDQDKMVAAEKMALLGRLVAGFAHELNTPVGVAVGVISQAREGVGQLKALLEHDEVSEDEIGRIVGLLEETTDLGFSSVRRAAELVKSFKRTAVEQSSEVDSDYDLADLIHDVLRSLNSVFRATDITIRVDCPPATVLHGPAGVVIQILSNLLLNSRAHAFADGARSGYIDIRGEVSDARAILEFRDDGLGMSEEVRARVFEPFFTTRRDKGGSGLGLYIVYNLVTQGLHGSIQCSSSPGQGTLFHIEYPDSIDGRVEVGA